MKKILLFSLALGVSFTSFSQVKVKNTNKEISKVSLKKSTYRFSGNEEVLGTQVFNPTVAAAKDAIEVGTTTYDLQSNSCVQNRMWIKDANVSATWTIATDQSFATRGTGYNSSADAGATWGPAPTARIEGTKRTGWPSIYQTNSTEQVIAHDGTSLYRSVRNLGESTWSSAAINCTNIDMNSFGPTWPRATAVGDTVYAIGSDGNTIAYMRSTDAGATFIGDTTLLKDPGFLAGLGGDGYAIDAKENVVVIVTGTDMSDLLLFKSTDYGVTFTKTVIFKSSCPSYKAGLKTDANGDDVADTIIFHDGVFSVVLDNNKMAHVSGGIQKYLDEDGAGLSWFPHTDGLWYWNESKAPLFIHAMDGSALGTATGDNYMDSTFIVGYIIDENGNNELDFYNLAGFGTPNAKLANSYYSSMSSHPTMAVSPDNGIAIVYSSVNEVSEASQTNQAYRNINLVTIKGNDVKLPINLTQDPFAEHQFASVWKYTTIEASQPYIHFVYQSDDYPGLNVRGNNNNHPVNTNNIFYIKYATTFPDKINNVSENKIISVSNYPNPFNGATTIAVNLNKHANVSVVITDLLGKVVMEIPSRYYGIGTHTINVDASNLTSGIYIYNVKADNFSVSNKMIVE